MPEESKPKLTEELVRAKLRNLNVRAAAETEAPREDWSYHTAAAVLSYFDPEALRPVGEPRLDRSRAISLLLADSTFTLDADDNPRWMLRRPVRVRALKKLGTPRRLREALAENKPLPRDPLQQMLGAYISGEAPPLTEQNLEQLAGTLQVAEWLGEMVRGLPPLEEVRRRIAFESLLKPFRYLAGEHFRGRHREMSQLREYVEVLPPGSRAARASRFVRKIFDWQEKPPLMIYGPGGMGKSSLVARFILEHVEHGAGTAFPFVYLDFDRASLAADEALTLLHEALRQLGVQFPEASERCRQLSEDWERRTAAALERRRGSAQGLADQELISAGTREEYARRLLLGPDVTTPPRDYMTDFRLLYESLGTGDSPFLVVLDTFEEVQRRSLDAVDYLLSFMQTMQASIPRLRVVISGRARVAHYTTEPLELGDLDGEAALGFLEANGVADPTLAGAVVRQIGGNPLSLKLAAEVVRKESAGEAGIAGLGTRKFLFFRVEEELIQGQLYARILSHIADEEVRKLAHPGLILRRITPELIRQVLAGPCNIKVGSLERARELFTKLGQEVSLVMPDEDEEGALRHRPDVRRVMIRLLQRDEPEKVQQIHKAAVRFYAKQRGVRARAEELYHSLSLGERPDARRWVHGVGEYLAGAVEELPPEAQAYLASRLGLELDESTWALAEISDWERHVEKRASNLLKRLQPQKALSVLRERPERSPASALHLLEATALEMTGDLAAAELVALRGIEAYSYGRDTKSLEMALLLARIYAKTGRFTEALRHVQEAKVLAERFANGVRRIELLLDELHLRHLAGGASVSDSEVMPVKREMVALMEAATDEELKRVSWVVREAAGHVGAEYPPLVERVLRLVGTGWTEHVPGDSLAAALAEWDLRRSEELKEKPGLLARSLGLKPYADLEKTWTRYMSQVTPRVLDSKVKQLAKKHPIPPSAAKLFAAALLMLAMVERKLREAVGSIPSSQRV